MRKLRLLTPLVLVLLAPVRSSWAQQRPLLTQDVDTLETGQVRLQLSVDFLQDAKFPLSGLRGDLTQIGLLSVNVGVARRVEFQIEGALQNFLDVKKQTPAFLVPQLDRGDTSTNDFGDFLVATKIKILEEKGWRPALGIRPAMELPTSNQDKGIGTNTTNFLITVLGGKHFGKLNTFGNLGLGILQAPMQLFEQNDVLLYGAAAIYPLRKGLNVVAEVNGRASTRNVTPVGTESRSQARYGVQIFWAGFRWDVAGVVGLTDRDPAHGISFGISRDLRLFSNSAASK